MGFKEKFSSSNSKFATKFSNDQQEYSPNFGTYNTIYNGENGATFYPDVSEEGILSWTNDRELPNPPPVKVRGEDGTDGVSVISVRQTITSNADGGTNVVTITLSNGDNYTFTVINGNKGEQGEQGIQGKDGYTPIKGTDYWTPTDKAEMVNDVISALPKYNGEVVDV